MEHYSGIKRNEVMIYATTWVNLENNVSEGSRTQKVKYCVIHFIQNVQNRPIQRDRKQINGYGAGRGTNGA